jgi:hypothetical protein
MRHLRERLGRRINPRAARLVSALLPGIIIRKFPLRQRITWIAGMKCQE